MRLIRCAWHARYYGYPRLLGVGSWRGLRVQFADGICPTCATRVMSDYTQATPPPETTRWPGATRAAALFVGVPLTAALVLAATPLSEPPPMPPALSALPSSVTAAVARPELAAAPRASHEAIGRDCDKVARRAVAAARRRGATPAVVMAPPIITASRIVTLAPSRAVIAAHAAGRPLAPPSIVSVAHAGDRVELQSP